MQDIAKIQTAAVKLIFSSLFARKSKYLVFGIENKPHTWYMTNISDEEITVFKPNMTQFLSEVFFIKTEIQDLIVSMFPLLTTSIGIIDATTVCCELNKHDKQKNISSAPLVMELAEDHFTIVLKGNNEPVVCGRLLSPEIVGRYASLLDQYINRNEPKEDPRELVYPINIDSFNTSIVNDMVIYSDRLESLSPIWRVAVPLKDGFNMVSISEYVKKSKTNNRTMELVITNNKIKTFRTAVRYIDDNIKVITIQPAASWFPLPNIQLSKD